MQECIPLRQLLLSIQHAVLSMLKAYALAPHVYGSCCKSNLSSCSSPVHDIHKHTIVHSMQACPHTDSEMILPLYELRYWVSHLDLASKVSFFASGQTHIYTYTSTHNSVCSSYTLWQCDLSLRPSWHSLQTRHTKSQPCMHVLRSTGPRSMSC